ncbi:MG2 domain-containing protein [Chryseobacterium aahli]|uniref:alpha-2-macroglobulin family protein n=1 Tax=Chryseobacterium aahli TaxID=1278643 RepID=UPI001F61C2F0|nr:MG2 domain-containing protein [Chryseobacterium aahli]MCI3938622.1 MG2 domain-containing protein [Chryseobacterium aahli]
MKKLLIIFSVLISYTAFSQSFYETKWKKVAESYSEGFYKSSLPIILEIQKQAIKDGNDAQLIRSLKAEFAITKDTKDDVKNDLSSVFFAKIDKTEKFLKGDNLYLFQVLKMEFVNDYFQQNSWRIAQRTNSDNGKLSEIELWTKLDFKNFFTKEFAYFETKNNEFKNIKLEKYSAIFEGERDFQFYNTLYEWKTNQYITYLRSDYIFTNDEQEVNNAKIVSLYDQLIENNSGNSKLYFQHQKINFKASKNLIKDKLPELETLLNSNINGDYKIFITFDIANLLNGKNEKKRAVELLRKTKSDFPNSKFLNNIINLENTITQPSIKLQYQLNIEPEKPIHLVVEHSNVSQLKLEVFKIEELTKNLKYINNIETYGININYYNQGYVQIDKKIESKLIRTENISLPNLQDFLTKKTSIDLKPLERGVYYLRYNNFEKGEQFIMFFVSDARIVILNKDKPQLEYQWVKSDNGNANKQDRVDIFPTNEFYDGVARSCFLKTGKDGSFSIAELNSRNYDGYFQSFILQNPETSDTSLYAAYDYNRYENYNREISQIFLDRAIYRPEQTVLFKVILTKEGEKRDIVVPNLPIEVALYDANSKEVSKQQLKTNEFGSVQGSFILPKGLLNGQFRIQVNTYPYDSSKYFAVEEYKRPKFEIIFDDLKEEYKYGKTIELTGKATSYSGVPLGDVDVKYEIKKQNIRWRYFWWYPQVYTAENSIIGKAKTNEKGEFTIKVDLKKDEKIEGIQIDNYEVNASVTDISGETQSEKIDVKVATVSHYIEVGKIGEVFNSEEVIADVKMKNYNDQILHKTYNVELYKLKEPARIIRNNFKSAVQNLPKLSKEEFLNKFPHDLYDENEAQKNWKKEKVLSKNTSDAKLNLGKLHPAYYELVLSNIEDKDTIKSVQTFEVWNKRKLGKNQFPFLKLMKQKGDFARGEKVSMYAYSAIPNAIGTIYIQDGNGKTTTEIKKFRQGVLKYEVEIPKDKDIIKLNYQIGVVGFNDLQNEYDVINIKADEIPIKIEVTSFRDKIEPNSKEKWSIKVSGDQKEKIVAEVLANMYDKSLDKFAVNKYDWQKIYRPFYQFKDYSNPSFLKEIYDTKYPKHLNFPFPYQPDFNWFSINFFNELLKEYNFLSSNDTDGDGVLDYEDACPTVPGMSEYNGCPKPRHSAVAEVSSSMKDSSRFDKKEQGDPDTDKKPEELKAEEKIEIRKNLNETAFFYPNLVTDRDGNVSFEFEGPEALTKWKMMFLAHTKDGRAATLEKDVITQKDFSVTPNYPRFLREGDELVLQSKISSLLETDLNGEATLQILDAFTNEDITSRYEIIDSKQNFNLKTKSSNVVSWKLKTPYGKSSAIILRILAKAGTFSDGEQSSVAVLPNRMLVTDTQPIFVKEGQTKTFTIKNLKETTSKSIVNYSNTLELSTNPVWEIIFALPDLNAYLNISSDGVFNAWFADVVAAEIFKANPKMEKIFNEYQDNDLMKSNLEKNQELKQLLLEETPWVLESENEEDQMKRVARLFDANKMRKSINEDWDRLLRYQNSDGGFPWLPGYESSYYNSIYILNNLGKINGWLKGNMAEYQSGQNKMVSRLISYLDNYIESKWDDEKDNPWSNFAIDYLYSRNFWEKEYPLSGKGAMIKKQVMEKGKVARFTDFTFFGIHRVALLFDDYGMKNESKKILNYLKETSTDTETQGLYWKQNFSDWGWYNSKTVNHAGAIEAVAKLTPQDQNFIEEAKIWLATQKEVNSWGTSRATAEIIYIFMNSGKSWTADEADKATVIWGGKNIIDFNSSNKLDKTSTGYIKKTVKSEVVDQSLATVTVSKPGPGIAQGGIFWQYYEDLDKIKSSESYISITKEFYKKVKTENGDQLVKITENSPVKVGDVVTIRMILNTDRPMQYVHLKDMRAAGFEPIDVISTYHWKNNLGYYQATKDASTNFYIQNMPKGNYVFDYDLVANASGDFSGGIATMQNYYAPQMNAHSEGRKLQVAE